MRKTVAFVLLFLLSASFASSCVGYTESFDVQVLDAKLRPVENAAVQVKYDRGASFGEQYFVTPPEYTDSNGMFHVEIYNQGTTSREIDCNIYLNATIGGGTTALTVVVDEHGSIVSLVFPDVYKLVFRATDQHMQPLADAKITVDDWTKNANSAGVAVFYLKAGEHQYLVSYMDGKRGESFLMDDDITRDVTLSSHSITIDVLDDEGVGLNSAIFIFDESFGLEEGHFEWTRTFGDEIPYLVRYAGLEKSGSVIPAESTEELVVFDVHSPVFRNFSSGIVNSQPRITVEVVDGGQYSSGLDASTFRFWYRAVGSGGSWNSATAFQDTPESFNADLPPMEGDTLIEFRTEVRDKSGNHAELEGTVKIEKEKEDDLQQEDGEVEEQEFPFFYILIGIIIVILMVYVVIHIKGKGGKYPDKQ